MSSRNYINDQKLYNTILKNKLEEKMSYIETKIEKHFTKTYQLGYLKYVFAFTLCV